MKVLIAVLSLLFTVPSLAGICIEKTRVKVEFISDNQAYRKYGYTVLALESEDGNGRSLFITPYSNPGLNHDLQWDEMVRDLRLAQLNQIDVRIDGYVGPQDLLKFMSQPNFVVDQIPYGIVAVKYVASQVGGVACRHLP